MGRIENLSPELENELRIGVQKLGARLLSDDRPPLLISDLDETHSHRQVFHPDHNSHEPVIEREIIDCNQVPLVVATARRANHVFSFTPWSSGLVPEEVPLVLENGGIVATRVNGEAFTVTTSRDLDVHREIHDITDVIATELTQLDERNIVVKYGLTLASLRIQGSDGRTQVDRHDELADAIVARIADERIAVVNTGGSVTIQEASVDKFTGGMVALWLMDIEPSGVHVVGFGDSFNDLPLVSHADTGVIFGEKITAPGAITLPKGHRPAVMALMALARASTR